MGRPRCDQVFPDQVQTFHCISRCVRQSPLLQSEINDRKGLLHRRLIELASSMAIDLIAVSLMDNHFHTELTTRPDLATEFTPQEVARRWFGIYPESIRRWAMEHLIRQPDLYARRDPTNGALSDDDAIEAVARQEERIASLRRRLSSMSEFHQIIKQEVAWRANKEDGMRGHFWDARYKSIEALDDAGRLMIAMYIDLNPVRAALCGRPEDARFTSAHDRIVVWQYLADEATLRAHPGFASGTSECDLEHAGALMARSHVTLSRPGVHVVTPLLRSTSERDPDRAVWLAPVLASLGIELAHYLELLDVVGRIVRHDKRGAIPTHLPPILERIGVKLDDLARVASHRGELRGTVIGSPDACAAAAQRRGVSRVLNAFA